MSNETVAHGRCLCGSVSFTATIVKPSVSVCHCDMCRRWTSSPFMAVKCSSVAFEGVENVGRIRSSDWAERGFCTACGSSLFYHLMASPDYQMAAGLFEDPGDFRLSLQLFIDEKPAFYDFANDCTLLTGEELIAMALSNDENL